MKSKFILAAALSMSLAQAAWALTEGVQKLVRFETKANAVSTRSDQAILLPHVEIPLSMVGVDFAKRMDPQIAASLVFEKSGQKYVRWILNPEDTKWGKELIAHFASKGVQLTVQHYMIGYQTASRSYIAEDPISGAQFSVKSSTNNTGGAWRDKKQPVGEAIDGRLISDFLSEQNRRRPFENFTFMDEPAILKVDAIDQAVVIRDVGILKSPDNKMSYLPGFSALHEKLGAEIARKNGSNDPFEFWTRNYIQVAGRALGELAARTGLQFDSPHSQNFLVELDADMKPTGRLVLRDMSDLYVDETFMKALYGSEAPILKEMTQKGNLLDYIAAGFGPLHGNQKPRWVDEAQYKQWNDVFFNEFEQSFQKVSGYDLKQLKAQRRQNGDYFGATYRLTGKESFQSFFAALRSEGVVRSSSGSVRCQYVHASGF